MQTIAVTANANMASQIRNGPISFMLFCTVFKAMQVVLCSDTAPIPKANRQIPPDHGEVVGPALATDHGDAEGDGFGVGHRDCGLARLLELTNDPIVGARRSRPRRQWRE